MLLRLFEWIAVAAGPSTEIQEKRLIPISIGVIDRRVHPMAFLLKSFVRNDNNGGNYYSA